VWPWLVQMGYGRAGYYTWYRYDNGGVPSATRIIPELQGLKVGDVVPDGPKVDQGFGVWRVVALDPPRALLLRSRRNLVDGREIPVDDTSDDAFVDCTWAFVLEEAPCETTKVLVRVRASLHRVRRPALAGRAARLLFGVGDTVMERTLLEGLRQRVEH
jgi:hypothetical protein